MRMTKSEFLAVYIFLGCKEIFHVTMNSNKDSLPYSQSITLTLFKEKKNRLEK